MRTTLYGAILVIAPYKVLSIRQPIQNRIPVGYDRKFLDKYRPNHSFYLSAAAITYPFEQAFFPMVHLPYLQPFEDVNKRVSRLAANIPLIRENLCPLSFVDGPERAYVDGILGVYELIVLNYCVMFLMGL